VNPNFPKASPIYVNNTQICKEFLIYWIERCEFNEMNLNAKVFDHEVLMGEVLPEFIPKIRLGMLGHSYAIWPRTPLPNNFKPMITMGIADGESKEKSLREMGLSEDTIKFNLVGNI
jgi:hypothetical protein